MDPIVVFIGLVSSALVTAFGVFARFRLLTPAIPAAPAEPTRCYVNGCFDALNNEVFDLSDEGSRGADESEETASSTTDMAPLLPMLLPMSPRGGAPVPRTDLTPLERFQSRYEDAAAATPPIAWAALAAEANALVRDGFAHRIAVKHLRAGELHAFLMALHAEIFEEGPPRYRLVVARDPAAEMRVDEEWYDEGWISSPAMLSAFLAHPIVHGVAERGGSLAVSGSSMYTSFYTLEGGHKGSLDCVVAHGRAQPSDFE